MPILYAYICICIFFAPMANNTTTIVQSSTGALSPSVLAYELGVHDQGSHVKDVIDHLQLESIPNYSTGTRTLLMMNNSYNSASYMKDDLQSKLQNASSINAQARVGIHKMRAVYMQKKNTIGYLTFISGVVQALVVIACLSAVLAALYMSASSQNQNKMWYIVGACVIFALFLTVVAVIVKNNYTRRPDDWNKFYFTPNKPSREA